MDIFMDILEFLAIATICTIVYGIFWIGLNNKGDG